MLKFEEVTYCTPLPRSICLFDEASLRIKKGENTIISGENGSGKTTFVKLAAKLISPSSGRIEGGSKSASVVFECFNEQLFFSTVKEELGLFKNTDQKEYGRVFDIFGFNDIIDRTIFELSYFEKSYIVISIAYLLNRDFIIIDSVPLDERIRYFIDEITRDKKRTIIYLTPDKTVYDINSTYSYYVIKDKKIIKL